MSMLEFVQNIIESFILAWFSGRFVHVEKKKFPFYLLLVTVTQTIVISTLNVFYIYEGLWSLLYNVCLFACMWLFRDQSAIEYPENIVIYIIIENMIFSVGGEIANVITMFFLPLIGSSFNEYMTSELFYLQFFLSRPMIAFMLYQVNKRFGNYTSLKNKYANHFIVAFFAIYVIVIQIEKHVYAGPPHQLLNACICITLFFICWFMYDVFNRTALDHYKEQEETELAMILRNTKNAVQMYEEKEESLRALKHDMKNQFLVMHEFMQNKEYDTCDQIIQNSIEKIDHTSIMVSTGCLAVDAMISTKLSQARNLGIQTHYSGVRIPVEDDVYAYEIAMILGNLLDNAIENNIPNDRQPYIYLTITNNIHFTITVRNSTDNQTIDFKTNKNDTLQHGWGLKNIERIANRHNGKMTIKITDGECKSQVTLKDIH